MLKTHPIIWSTAVLISLSSRQGRTTKREVILRLLGGRLCIGAGEAVISSVRAMSL